MVPRRALFAFAAVIIAAGAFAQTADTSGQSSSNPAIFGSVSGGELAVIAKTSQHWSGSFGVMTSANQYPFANSGIGSGSGSSRGYNATFGGTLVKDRAWFFASAERNSSNNLFSSQFDSTLPQTSSAGVLSANANAQIGSRQAISSTFSAQQSTPTLLGTPMRASSSFLSLNYTGVVSDNMFFTAKVSRSGAQTTAQP